MSSAEQIGTKGAAAALSFQLPGGGQALFTGRAEGNMSSRRGERPECAVAARERLCQRIGVRALAHGRQVHGSVVHRVTSVRDACESRPGAGAGAGGAISTSGHREREADGQATGLRGVATMVLGADCLPVALGCRGAVAMVHVGWRGLAAGVLEEGVRAVLELGQHDELTAVIGPGAGPCCYEVGPEVHRAFSGVHRVGRRIDLWSIARERLSAAGVTEVHEAARCTICDERYFSHRREGARAGRQAGVAWLS